MKKIIGGSGMVYFIRNSDLEVAVSDMGAEMQSIRASDGLEYLWQGDPAYWKDRAPTLFPYVGRMVEKSYYLDGKKYHMDIHGFASEKQFSLVEQTAESLTLLLEQDADTLRQYPRSFRFLVSYSLEGTKLNITYRVENTDSRDLHFGLGGHPGFRVPLCDGEEFSDYQLRFSTPCDPRRVVFTENCFVEDYDVLYPLGDNGCIPLTHALFDNDAVVLKNTPREVVLENRDQSKAVTVSFPKMPYIGFWHANRTDAPYVCIEPWCSLPSPKGGPVILEEQKDLLCLEPGGTYVNAWSIAIQ